ncbi:hypothetical protein BGZ83_011535 [Gryganskiella cystojenkinii]|nr:hypothetical protein BGZ83_011535 [Gryganskiella cystojenkinii]
MAAIDTTVIADSAVVVTNDTDDNDNTSSTATSPSLSPTQSQLPTFIFSDDYICQWDGCLKKFDDPELLYAHLRDDHVGRKAQHNLCLTCRWENCTVQTFVKRDHITSHLRVHVSSKPHRCSQCRKAFKRPQDLRKHEKTHDPDQEDDNDKKDNKSVAKPKPKAKKRAWVELSTQTTAHNNGATEPVKLLQPNNTGPTPLTPPTTLDHSPSLATVSRSSLSPYPMPPSPADTAESWNNPGLSSPSYSTNSDLYCSPIPQDLQLDLMNTNFGITDMDMTGSYYDSFAQNGFDDMLAPLGSKRSRDDSDMILADTLGFFAAEAKRTKLEPSYNQDVIGRLDTLSALLESDPSKPDRIFGAFQDMTDWNQVNDLNQFCTALLEDVSGELFVPHSFNTSLFPEYNDEKLSLEAMEAALSSGGIGGDPLFGSGLPANDAFLLSPAESQPFGSDTPPWDVVAPVAEPKTTTTPPPAAPCVRRASPVNNELQNNRYANRDFVSLSALQKNGIKVEPMEMSVPKVSSTSSTRQLAKMGPLTQAPPTAASAIPMVDGPSPFGAALMLIRMPVKDKPTKKRSTEQVVDAQELLDSAPKVPDVPLVDRTIIPEGNLQEQDSGDQEQQDLSDISSEEQLSSEEGEIAAAPLSISPESASKSTSFLNRAKARHAAAATMAAALKAAKSSIPTNPVDAPVDAMTRQLAGTHISSKDPAPIVKSPTTRPVEEGDLARRMKAVKARTACARNPVRQKHAQMVVELLKGIDALMTARRLKELHERQKRSADTEHTADLDYNQLRSTLRGNEENSAELESKVEPVSADSLVVYPISEVHRTSALPFELTEEERRIIEADTMKTAAAISARP